jgi:hypothetical protein
MSVELESGDCSIGRDGLFFDRINLGFPPPNMAPNHGLSVELLDMIIDELALGLRHERASRVIGSYSKARDLVNTLCACALTSSAMRIRAQHHLYSRVKIRNHERAGDLLDMFSACPTLAACMRTLVLDPSIAQRDTVSGLWIYRPSSSLVSLAGLLRVPSLSAHVTALVFENVDFSEFAVRSRRKCLDEVTRAVPPLYHPACGSSSSWRVCSRMTRCSLISLEEPWTWIH